VVPALPQQRPQDAERVAAPMPQYKIVSRYELQEPPAPVRASMDETKLEELAGSIRLHGVLQPLVVVPIPDSAAFVEAIDAGDVLGALGQIAPTYRIVAGHRRFLASQMAGLKELPCMVYESGTLAEEAAMLAENVHRENLTPAEEGLFFAEYVEKHKPLEADLPRIFGQSLNYIYERMTFVAGPVEIVQANAERKINFGVAKELMRCTDDAHRKFLLMHAIEGGATATVVHKWIVDWRQSQTFRSAEASGAPVAVSIAALPQAPQGCVFCGSKDNPEHFVQVAIHKYELATLAGILGKLGVHSGG
jgi:ParB/RepB/Spo0J family partition protein